MWKKARCFRLGGVSRSSYGTGQENGRHHPLAPLALSRDMAYSMLHCETVLSNAIVQLSGNVDAHFRRMRAPTVRLKHGPVPN